MAKFIVPGVGAGIAGDSTQLTLEADFLPKLIEATYSPDVALDYNVDDQSIKAKAAFGLMGPLGFWGYSYARASVYFNSKNSAVSPGAELGFLAPSALGLVGVPQMGLDLKFGSQDLKTPLDSAFFLVAVNTAIQI